MSNDESITMPRVRCDSAGFARLGNRPSGRLIYRTHSGLEIGCRWLPPQPRDQGVSADRVQDLILWGRRPLAFDQVLVAALCVPGRRP